MWYNLGMRNDVRLCWDAHGSSEPSHFCLWEFESNDGTVVVDARLVRALELVRRELGRHFAEEVQIVITSGTRSPADNERLAKTLGWVEDGGLVARDSRHLPKYGGIAADLYARYKGACGWIVVDQEDVAAACRRVFRYVKADYQDGHVHADNRS